MSDARLTDQPKTSRRRRSPHGMGLFITDLELVEMLGVPERQVRAMLQELDRDGGRRSGFPQPVPQWGGRRYRPAVEAYFNGLYGPKMGASQPKERPRVR